MLLLTVVSSFIFTQKKKTVEIFPVSVREAWNECELRFMVLISLALQAILILIGNWRKNSTGNEDSEGDSVNPNFVMIAFWAPFLFLHLGGPDKTTAYSLEDNELWLRHLLGVAVQVIVALYRTWVLRSASSEHFRESMLPPPHAAEGFRVEPKTFIEAPIVFYHYYAVQVDESSSAQNAAVLNKAYSFFETFKRLCANLILTFHVIENSQSFFQHRTLRKL
ncbi:hypothetical protein D8674_035386 [Pyrus ussuriensis x Pyrus communis]|uniref:DUF4220 domain-containing protein n=1 Tax=Pyrus ussuriensis x Pyrus communis TaxID=2448454 RepID=A0A5N5GIC2_9ROSA|nr:hypothetical protein D8674_035386 [Pyrus ussuriensis x Pyrus communis]